MLFEDHIDLFADLNISGQVKSIVSGVSPMVVTSRILNINFNADLLDDEEGSYYLDFQNFTGRAAFSQLPQISPGLIGRYSSGTGDMQQITLGAGFSLPGGVLTYTETDPTVPAHVKGITSGDITNWNTAYGWGDFRQYGLAVPYSLPSGNDLSTIDFTGFVRTTAGTDYPPGIAGNGFVISNYISNVRGQQLAMAVSSDRLFFRRNYNGWQPWVELVHSSNLSSFGYVPYTGATQEINFNTQSFRIGGDFNKSFSTFERSHLYSNETSVQHFTRLTDVASWSNTNDTSTPRDCIVISIPITTSTRWVADVDIFSGSGSLGNIFPINNPLTIRLSAYGVNNTYRNVTVTGSVDAVASVAFGRNLANDRTIIIIRPSNLSSTPHFSYGKVNISKFYHGVTYSSELAVKSNYSVTSMLESDLTDFTLSGEVTNAQFTRDSYYLDANNFINMPSAQTLSLGTGAGNIAISGGNSVDLKSLGTTIIYDANDMSLPRGIHSIWFSGGDNFPSANGAGIRVKQNDTGSQGYFDIIADRGSGGKLWYRRAISNSAGTFHPWHTFASEEWTASNYYSKTESDGRYLSALTVNGENYLTIDSGSKTLTAGVINLNSTHTSGVLPIAKGGTGLSSLGTAGQFLRVNGAGNALEYYSIPSPVVPDLQSVTDQGAVTSNDITIEKAGSISSIIVRESISGAYSAMGAYSSGAQIGSTYGTFGAYLLVFPGSAGLMFVNAATSDQWSLQYVSDGVASLDSGHQLRVQQDPIHNDDLTRKAYVDNLVKDGTLTLSTGDGLTGSASFSANQSTNSTFTVGLSAATNTIIGGVKLFSNTVQSVAANAVTSTASRTYGVQVNSSGQLVVNVPWTDNNTTYSGSNGISLSGTVFSPVYGTTAGTIAEGNHVHSIQQLTDVDYIVVADGDVLAYDGIDGIWKPFTLPAFPTNYYTKTESDARYLPVTNKYVSVFNNSATTNSVASLDFDDAPMSTILRAEPAVNSPEGSGLIYTFGDAGSRGYQLFQGHGYNDSFWYRTRLTLAGGWREWLQVASRSWTSSTYVQKAGDTMTGTLYGTRIVLNDQFEVTNPTAPNHKIWLVATPTYTRLNMGYGGHVTLQLQVAENGTTYFVHNIGDGSEQRMIWDTNKNVTFNVAERVHVNGDVRSTGQLVSTVANGTSPLQVTSSTLVTNLNTDFLDGQHGSYYLSLSNATGVLPVTKGGTGLTSVGTNGQLLRSNGTSLEYFTPAFLTSVALGDLTNVTLSTPASGQALVYNGTAWVNTTLPSIPTNYVTTNTNQTGLGGNKTWTGHHIIAPGNTSSPTSVANSVRISRNTNGAFVTIENGSAVSALTLRSWNGGADNKYQISLLTGGVETGNHGNSENWYTAWQRINPTNLGRTGNGVIANNTTLNSEQAWSDLPIGYSAFVYSNVGLANGAPDNTYGYFTKVANRDVGGGWAGLWIDHVYNAFYIGKAHENTTFATWSRVLTAYTPTTLSSGQLLQWNGTGWTNWTPNFVSSSATISAGNGLTGGGVVSTNPTITLGTPGNITLSSSNSVSTSSHTHAFVPGGSTSQYIRGDGTLATFPAIPTDYVPSTRTLQFTAGSGLSVSGTASTNLSVDRTVTYSLTFGTTAGTVAQGNDSRINNGQTAYGWGNHASAGYVPQTRELTFGTGDGLLVSGTSSTNLSVNRNVNYAVNFGTGVNQVARGNHNHDGVYVPTSRTITINGVTQNLSDNRSWTISAGVTGSGSNGYIARWNSGTGITNSELYQSGSNIGIGTTSPADKLTINGTLGVTGDAAVRGTALHVHNNLSIGKYDSVPGNRAHGSLLVHSGDTSTYAHVSAALEIRSTTKALLLPRQSTTQWDNIGSKPEGLFSYDTTDKSIRWFTGTETIKLFANNLGLWVFVGGIYRRINFDL